MSSGANSKPHVYQRYCGGAIASGLFAVSLIAIFAAILFMPIFVFAGDGTKPVFVSGLDLIFYAFRDSITKGVYGQNPKLLFFDLGVSAYSGQSQFFLFLGKNHVYFEIGLVAIFGIAATFAIIVVILGLIFLFAGRNRNTILVSSLCSSVLFTSILFFGLGFLYFFLTHKMFLEMGANVAMKIHYFSFIFIGLILAVTIVLNVIYRISFRGKRFAGAVQNSREMSNKDFVPQMVSLPPYMRDKQNQNQSQQSSVPPYQRNDQVPPYQRNNQPTKVVNNYPNDIPNDISEIGENAFAMNTDIKHVLIPEGIYYLGPGAFSNCLYLETITIPRSVIDIGYNCFFNTPSLKEIKYLGTMEEFNAITKGSNWLTLSGANFVETQNGKVSVEHQ